MNVTPYYQDESVTLYCGDCRDTLKQLPEASVQTCVTSPPYFALRNYGVDGQIGLEQTPDAYVAEMVAVFGAVRRVLKDDDTLWVNIGDSFNAYNGNRGAEVGLNRNHATVMPGLPAGNGLTAKDLKPKDLIGIPWMLAFALRADGWYLRGDHIWAKPNGMPESVEDRPTRAHEYVFLLSKSARYYYDGEAVRTAPKASTITRLKQDQTKQAGSLRANGGQRPDRPMKCVARATDKQRGHSRRHAGFNDRWDAMERDEQMIDGANLRSVWWIPPAQCSAAHFAVMPPRVAEICIRAGARIGDMVLDPFNGSGTTGQVARDLQCNYVGVELNADYCAISVDRWRQGVLFGAGGAA